MSEQPPIHILAVDDRPANLLALDAMLEDLDVRIVHASSGEDALAAAARADFALILMDLVLPGIDGLETARMLRQREASRHVPIIFLTAYDRVEQQVEKAYELGAVDFLFKPIVAPILISKIAVFVELHRKTIAVQRQQELLREAQERAHEQDLTEQRARWVAEQLRREVILQRNIAAARQQQAVTLRCIGDAVIATDAARRITLLNRAAEELCGWTEEAARGLPLEEVIRLVHPESREPRDLANLAGDSILLARDGSEHRVGDSLAPIVDDTGGALGQVLVFRDVTAQRRMEQELQNNQRLESLGQLAAGIAHDFNNMLAMIMASSSLAVRELNEPSMARTLFEDIENTCEKATGLTHQLLTFAQGGAPVRKPSEISPLVRDAVAFSLRGSGTECRFEFDEELWPAEVDAGQITQVLSNLALNARDAMRGQGAITVRAKNVKLADGTIPIAPGDYVWISVEDHGAGIQRHQLERIFDPYFTTKPGHQGLGLASSHSVVRRHGGHLRAESMPGSGSIFHVYLPASPGTLLAEPPPVSEAYAGGGHVLVMDDEPRLRDLLTECLVALKCRVRVAAHGDEAIALYREMFEHDPFDVVVLDLTIRGGKGGAETLRELRALDPGVLAIACSGYSNDPIMCDHARHGFAEALEKPFRFAMLARAVRKVMARREQGLLAVAQSSAG